MLTLANARAPFLAAPFEAPRVGFEGSQPGQQLVGLLVQRSPPTSGARRRVGVVVLADLVLREEGAVAALLEGLA